MMAFFCSGFYMSCSRYTCSSQTNSIRARSVNVAAVARNLEIVGWGGPWGGRAVLDGAAAGRPGRPRRGRRRLRADARRRWRVALFARRGGARVHARRV